MSPTQEILANKIKTCQPSSTTRETPATRTTTARAKTQIKPCLKVNPARKTMNGGNSFAIASLLVEVSRVCLRACITDISILDKDASEQNRDACVRNDYGLDRRNQNNYRQGEGPNQVPSQGGSNAHQDAQSDYKQGISIQYQDVNNQESKSKGIFTLSIAPGCLLSSRSDDLQPDNDHLSAHSTTNSRRLYSIDDSFWHIVWHIACRNCSSPCHITPNTSDTAHFSIFCNTCCLFSVTNTMDPTQHGQSLVMQPGVSGL
jgi:hypothetical protein